jgi:hypothetical protein
MNNSTSEETAHQLTGTVRPSMRSVDRLAQGHVAAVVHDDGFGRIIPQDVIEPVERFYCRFEGSACIAFRCRHQFAQRLSINDTKKFTQNVLLHSPVQDPL